MNSPNSYCLLTVIFLFLSSLLFHSSTLPTSFFSSEIWYRLDGGALKSVNNAQGNSGFVLGSVKAQENLQGELHFEKKEFMDQGDLLRYLSGLNPVQGTENDPLKVRTVPSGTKIST